MFFILFSHSDRYFINDVISEGMKSFEKLKNHVVEYYVIEVQLYLGRRNMGKYQ